MVLAVFLATAVAFYVYNRYMKRDKKRVEEKFVRADTIVKSLFPEHVGNQLMEEAAAHQADHTTTSAPGSAPGSGDNLDEFLSGQFDDFLHIPQMGIEGRHMASFPLRFTMPDMVEGGESDSGRHHGVAHVLISARVLTNPMYEAYNRLSRSLRLINSSVNHALGTIPSRFSFK